MNAFQTRLKPEVSQLALEVSQPRALVSASPRTPVSPAISRWLELVYAVEALNPRAETVVLHFIGAMQEVGTSTVASGFARAAALSIGPGHGVADGKAAQRILYIDATRHAVVKRRRGSQDEEQGLLHSLRLGRPLTETIVPASGAEGVDWAWLGQTEQSQDDVIGNGDVGRIIERMRQYYAMVVIDSPAITRGIGALAVARHCDGSILVLRAGATTSRALQDAQEIIERAGGQVVGTVFNRVSRRSGWRPRSRFF